MIAKASRTALAVITRWPSLLSVVELRIMVTTSFYRRCTWYDDRVEDEGVRNGQVDEFK